MKNKVMVSVFCMIVFIPLILSVISFATGTPCDVELKGYTDKIDEPKLTIESFWSGDFQNKYSAWLENNLKPRGVLTKTSATIDYNLFNVGKRPIGKNHDVFEDRYLIEEFALSDSYDFTNSESQQEMQEYVSTLVSLQEKLSKINKPLYIYVAPTKTEFDYENIDNKYKELAKSDRVTANTYLRELLEKTELPYYYCSDMKDQLEYPAFYSTGIHWSRTYEQMASNKIIEDLAELTGKNYRKMVFADIQKVISRFGVKRTYMRF